MLAERVNMTPFCQLSQTRHKVTIDLYYSAETHNIPPSLPDAFRKTHPCHNYLLVALRATLDNMTSMVGLNTFCSMKKEDPHSHMYVYDTKIQSE